MMTAIGITGTAMAGSAVGQAAQIAGAPSSPAALSGLSCRTLADCVAVGATSPQMATGLVVERWNGKHWSRSALPQPAGTTAVTAGGVACPAARECVAVGSAYPRRGQQYAIAERWNGSRWSVGRAATAGVSSALYAIACPSAGNCYAVGEYTPKGSAGQNPLIEHWDGRSWHQEAVPVPGRSTFAYLADISCRTAAFCVAAGSSGTVAFVERWNGRRWIETTPPSAAGALLSGVACPAVTRCFAVGFGGAGNKSLVERWNGTTWSSSQTPGPAAGNSAGLQSISCVSPVRCLAVGNHLGNGVYAVSWNGRGWHLVAVAPVGGKLGSFGAVRCLSATNCVALGATTAFAATQRYESAFWNGRTWKIVATA
jgi:hypothetical protein